MATAAQRQHVAATIDFLKAHAAQLDYPPGDQRTSRDAISWALSEGQADVLLRGGGRMQLDCSEMGSWILKAAGLWHWSQPGYTGSHLAMLPHYSDAKLALTGALVVFGPGSGEHAVVVYKPDAAHGNPVVAGHGRPGFDIERLSVVAARHRPPVTFLSIAHL